MTDPGSPDEETAREYNRSINALRVTDAPRAVAQILRQSRVVMDWFPPSSSGAGDLAEILINELREAWGLPPDFTLE
jgi:hypothetical protein